MEYSEYLGNSEEDIMEEYIDQIQGPPTTISGVVSIFLLYCLFIAANIMLIVAVLSRKESQSFYGNWLLVNMALCLMVEAIIIVGYNIHGQVGLPTWYHVAGLCEFIALLQRFLVFATVNSILLVTLECLIKMIKDDGGFTKKIAIASIIGSDVLIAILILILDFGFGEGFNYDNFNLNGLKCLLISNYIIGILYEVLYFLILLTITILTIIIGVKSCTATSKQIKQAAIPLVASNICFGLFTFPSVIASLVLHLGAPFLPGMQYIWYISVAYSILVPLLWLGLSADLRRSYRDTCCPCCPASDEGETVHLLETKDTA